MAPDEQQADDHVADGKNLGACGAWAGPLARKSLNHGAVLKLNMPLVEITRTASGCMPVFWSRKNGHKVKLPEKILALPEFP